MRRRGQLGPATSARKVKLLDQEVYSKWKNILTPRAKSALGWNSMNELEVTIVREDCRDYNWGARAVLSLVAISFIVVATVTAVSKFIVHCSDSA